jgi:hypothetical protein
LSHPYSSLPDHCFWKQAVEEQTPETLDPVTAVPFRVRRTDAVATAGSCFAQHISRMLAGEGFNYLVTEREPATAEAANENYGVYPARFGNVYTVRQLLQLFDRAYGLFEPMDNVWQRRDGAWVDPFRPQIQDRGFSSPEAVEADRAAHLKAVRKMFEDCSFFVFTLGLTEGWEAVADGAVFPLAPGVRGGDFDPGRYRFRNFSVDSMIADLTAFLEKLRTVNPGVKVLLTVSPVALVATYEQRHVLVSTTYSKSALRVVAEAISRDVPDVAYFPSYEIITGSHSRGAYFADDCREVLPAGVAQVMSVFKRHYLADAVAEPRAAGRPARRASAAPSASESIDEVICDEIALERAR